MKVVILLSCLALAQGYNILCIQGLPSRSHFNMMYGIVKPLLQAGHQITLITVYPEHIKPIGNLTVIGISHVRKTIEGVNVLDKKTMGLRVIIEFARNVSNTVISTPVVRDVLTNNDYDAIINEWFLTDADAGYAAVQQKPWILLLGSVMSPYMEYLVDQIGSLSTVPLMLNDSDIPMSLWQRIKNTMYCLGFLIMSLFDKPLIIGEYERNFGPIAEARNLHLPSLEEAKHNISILFVNSHPSFAPARSLPPNVVDIAGYHIEDPSPLPKDLQKLLDSSKPGFIYFSMGSVVRTKDFTEKTKTRLLKTFEQLPYTVLWKDGPLKDLPKNVHVKPWFPQTSILAHPNIKLFITHGGLLSIIESLKVGVPVLSVPVYGDQPSNADRAVIHGYALKVEFSEDMGDELAAAVKEMMSNDRYYKRAKEISELFLSRPVTSSKLIQHYVELAIRSKGAYHLRSKVHLYRLYEVLMLDQTLIYLIILYTLFRAMKKTLRGMKRLLKKNKKD